MRTRATSKIKLLRYLRNLGSNGLKYLPKKVLLTIRIIMPILYKVVLIQRIIMQ